MRAIGIVPIKPVDNDPEGVVAALEALEPHALLLHGQENFGDRPPAFAAG